MQINPQLVQAAMADKAVGPAIASLIKTYAEGLPVPEHVPFAFAIRTDLIPEHFVGGVLPQAGDQLSLQVYDCQPITAQDEAGAEVSAHGVKARYLVIAPCGTPRHLLIPKPADEVPAADVAKTEAKKPRATRKPREGSK
jgi:hypothetical protein